MVVAPARGRARLDDRDSTRGARFARRPSTRVVVLSLIGIAALSTAFRVALLTRVHGPWLFKDELVYAKLAQSLGQSGHLALFNEEGVSYPPLYSAVLAPIYMLGASAPTAYHVIKIINALLMSLAVFPIYKIARFVLPRRASLFVAALSTLAPLMYYSAFVMSENLAYPLFLVSVWAMLVAVRSPGLRADALLIGSIVLATAARIQLVALLPAALTAVVLAAALGRERSGVGLGASVARVFRRHRLLSGGGVILLIAVFVRALGGHGLFSGAGSYSGVGANGFPHPWRLAEQVVEHLAGLDLAVGVIPFVAAIVAAHAFFRHGSRAESRVFASVALAVTGWLLLEVGFFAAVLSQDPQGGLPRIHERYLFYVVPLFLVALFAALRLAESEASLRVYLAAAAVTAVLPALIPFHSVINNSSVADTFALQFFARDLRDKVVPMAHVTVAAVWIVATFALLYVIVRNRTRGVVVLVLFIFILMSNVVRTRIESAAAGGRSVLAADRDWVDRAKPAGDVILVTGAGSMLPSWETAFNNLSISRVYYLCNPAFGGEFGERRIFIDRAGRLREPSGYVSASFAVVPASLGVRGRVLARNTKGHQALVASVNGRLSVAAAARAKLNCA